MYAEILATGEEIRTGILIDSNSACIAQRLQDIGVEVQRHTAVGDDLEALAQVLGEIARRCDVAVVTGGLGPTADDLTAAAAARAAEARLICDPAALQSIEAFFVERNRPMNPFIRKQALLPEGSACLFNPVGTAPGFRLIIDRCRFFFLPGVPLVMRRMLEDHVIPQIISLQGNERRFYLSKTISVFGLTESVTGEQVADVSAVFPEIQLGLRARFPEIQVKLYASGVDEIHLREQLEAAGLWVTQRLGDKVFSDREEPMEEVVGSLLRNAKASVAVAESCTGGLIADLLTDVAGSSDYFLLSAVTYSNASKVSVLHVPETILKTFGAVHETTAKAMAEGARQLGGTTFGLATTGIAGPSGATPDKPVGTVCIGLATPRETTARRFHFNYQDRLMNKKMFAMTALDLLRRELVSVERGG
jgi:nicotinamide-nucleotide amidase